jgi:hypothetical protein
MNEKWKDESSLAWKADAAFQQAAYKVIQRAKQTGTPVVIWEDDQIKEIPAEEMEMRMGDGYLAESRS